VSTALSSTDRSAKATPGWFAEARRAAADVRPLFAFRAGTLRGKTRRYAVTGLSGIGVITLLAAWLPAYLPDENQHRFDVVLLMPSALVGILVLSIVSAAASGGGRELLAREQAVAFPVSVTTDHLGALMMAPLNIAWLLQSWVVLGSVAYVLGPTPRLALSQVVTVLWLISATAVAQVIAWGIEWVRRGPQGIWAVRGVSVAAALTAAYLVAAHKLVPLLDNLRLTRWVVLAIIPAKKHDLLHWLIGSLGLVALLTTAVVLGALVAGAVAGRQPRDELRMESAPYRPRANAGSEFAAMLRTDRVGIWRSVPLRRGLFVLGVMPGAVAVAGGLQWEMLTILPGLVASGGALLFGVNSWCLDGRGALWRDSLPVEPKLVFASRVVVLSEVLLFATALTLVLASLRAGVPDGKQVAAVLCGALVVVLQVVGASLRWSVRRPYGVDLRSSRATPAPPLVMVGYSSRLALSTTTTGMVFAVTARVGAEWSLLVSVPFLIFSAYRLVQAAQAWADPDTRCHVVSTVAS
jgi:hypothetical protein